MYVLELEDNKYYVGVSDDPDKRFVDHLNGKGAAWTRRHRPRRILNVMDGGSKFEEDKVTKEYMAKYGIDNVRGGSYVLPTLPSVERKSLKKEIWMANKVCMRCGRPSHFVKDCYAKTDDCGDPIEDAVAVDSNRHKFDRNGAPYHPQNSTYRNQGVSAPPSHAHGHFIQQTIAQLNTIKKDLWIAEDACMRCGASSHYIRDCYARTDVYGNPIGDAQTAAVNRRGSGRGEYAPKRCGRCHRTNHSTSECYASTDTNGRDLC